MVRVASYFSHLYIYAYRQQKNLFIEVVYCNEGEFRFLVSMLTQGFGEIQMEEM